MRAFLESSKIIVGELIGLVGGFIWAQNTDWDYEPIILIAISGIGLLISILLLIFKDQSFSGSMNDENINLPITNIEPQTIRSRINDIPLLQQEDVANYFIGLNVRWTLKLLTIHKGKNNEVSVCMVPIDDTFILIKIDTNTDKYPILKIAEDGKKFTVSGRIVKCTKYDIQLELRTLEE